MQAVLKLHPEDNVAVATRAVEAGAELPVDGKILHVKSHLPMGHKIALRAIKQGENIVKYGFPIGHAREEILPGDWVHTHNVATNLGEILDYRYQPNWTDLPGEAPVEFMGYRRPDGKVGIRNEIWIIPTVGCVNAIGELIARKAREELTAGVNIDGITAYTHPYGCSQLGEDHHYTQKLLAGLIRHPNAGGVLVLGLGCENNLLADQMALVGDYDKSRIRTLICQEVEDEVEAGLAIVRELVELAQNDRREPCPSNELVVGLKCGGSDGFSGITANPLVGAFSDRIIAQGGSAILTEVPEMFGAEQLLMNRCRNEAVFLKTVDLINDFKSYFKRYDQEIDENPSPGNKEGGITTLEDKSLGCVQKGGRAVVEDVLGYGESVRKKGLSLLNGPGNDLVASCVLAAAGAHMVLFTTGRGTPFACPVPTVKVSSNSALAEKKRGWIDFDAGRILEAGMAPVAEDFFAYLLGVAGGEVHAHSEALDKSGIAIFKDGVTL